LSQTEDKRGRSLGLGAAAVLLLALTSLWVGVAAAAPRKFFGVVAWDNLAPNASQSQRLSRGGVGTLRFKFYWPEIESTPGAFNWSRYDGVVRDAALHHIRVLPFLFGTPGFLTGRSQNPPLANTSQRSAWRRFVKDAVRRYGPGGMFWALNPTVPNLPIRVWEVWNEESSPIFWYRQVNARSYASLLKITHAAAHEVDPKASLVVGGLFPWPQSKGAVPLSRYLPDLYAVKGVRSRFEGVAVHPYTPNWHWTKQVMGDVHQIMARHSDGHTGLFITEFGWSSGGPTSAYTRTPAGQAHQLTRVYRMLLNHRFDWHLRSVCWFVWRDRPRSSGEGDYWGLHTGLFDVDGHAKPAWRAYAAVAGGTP
jgi:hypothetical protein